MPGDRIELLVSESSDGWRLDRFLAAMVPQLSREYVKGLIQSGQVSLEGVEGWQEIQKPSTMVQQGQLWRLTVPEPVALNLVPEDLPVEVLFDDEILAVVVKPSGMLTHPVGPFQTGTLVNALLHLFQGQLSGINGVERPGIVHRLDKDTSGLLVIAKQDEAHRQLQAQLQARRMKRQYHALTQGVMEPPTGTIETFIGRDPKHREKMAVVASEAEGRRAVTHWSVLESVGTKAQLVQVNLDTGRTHQIRVHMAALRHPIFNDPMYGSGLAQQLNYPDRTYGQVLQATHLSFEHPVTHQALVFEHPLDEGFKQALDFLVCR